MTRTRITLAAALTLAAAGIAVVAGQGAFARGKDDMMRGDHAAQMMQRFAEADADRDGKVTAAEMRAAQAARFAKADANGDGKLTLEEMDDARKAGRIERLTRMVLWLDADGDGMLSVDEFDPRKGAMLSRMDADGDGALTQEEMRDAHKRFQHRQGGRHDDRHEGRHGGHHGTPAMGAPRTDGQKN